MTIRYPTAQERSHARANSFENPRLRARRTKEMIPVVTIPIESEKAIFRFSCVFMAFSSKVSKRSKRMVELKNVRHHFTIWTRGLPFSTMYVASSAALLLPTFLAE